MQLSPKAIQRIKLAFNVVFGAFIGIGLLRRAYFSIPHDWLFFFTSDAVENALFAIIAYALYYYVLKIQSLWNKVGFGILSLVILASLALLKDYRIHSATTFDDTFQYFTSFLGQALLFYGLIYFVNRLEFLNRNKKLESELNHAKEQLLRNQLYPHFLFNAFNSIYSLSLKNHPETSDYILKLSSMMRYVTDDTNLDQVRLSKEVDFIKQYIAIEKIRFGNEANIQFTINEGVNEEKLIAPFLLITLVENAFKHGFYTNAKGAFVKIEVNLNDNELLFTVENNIFEQQHFQQSDRKGKGLENLKQRLNLLYPKRSRLSNTNTDNIYTSQLNIILE